LRHIRSILYSLVLAPAAWVLTAVGLTGDLTARGRDGFAVENFTGLLLLMLAGAAYGILVLGPFSPAGPLLAGVVYLLISAWALMSPAAYADVWPPAVAKDGFDLSRPGYGLAAILAVPLICTALSARRWAKYEPPVLPLIGQIGRARGAAPAQGMPLSIAQTTVIGAGFTTTDPEPTTVLRLASADSTTAVVPAALASADSTVALVPAALASADSTTAVVAAPLSASLDEDPTIAWAVPKALGAVADENMVASSRTPQLVDEPATVVDVSVGEPTIVVRVGERTEPATAEEPRQRAVDEEPTEAVADPELVQTDDVTEDESGDVIEDESGDESTESVADEEPTQVLAESADAKPSDVVTDDTEPSHVVPSAAPDDEEPTVTIAESEDDEVVEATPPEGHEITEPTATADADDEPQEAAAIVAADDEPEEAAAIVAANDEPEEADADDEPEEAAPTAAADDESETPESAVADAVADESEEPGADEATVATPVPAAERTEVIRLPVADNGEKTQVVRLPVADNGERTQVVRLPVAEVVPFPAADPEEKTQVIRLPQVLQFPVRSPESEPGRRTRDLSNRATGDIGGDETQVIRLAGRTVDDEKTQVIRPALVARLDERSDVLAFRAPKLRDATPPPTADAERSGPTADREPSGPTAYPEPSGPTADGDASTSANVKAPRSIADAEAPNFADDPTSPIALSSRNGDEAAEGRGRSMTVMKMERPPDDPDEETTHLEIPAQRRPGAEE
jgi:hypothetical protein